jgi:hypothetical protein
VSDRQHCTYAVLRLVLGCFRSLQAWTELMARAGAMLWLGPGCAATVGGHFKLQEPWHVCCCKISHRVSTCSVLWLVCEYAPRLQATCQPLTLAGQHGSCASTARKICLHGRSAQPRRELAMCCRFVSAGLEGSTGQAFAFVGSTAPRPACQACPEACCAHCGCYLVSLWALNSLSVHSETWVHSNCSAASLGCHACCAGLLWQLSLTCKPSKDELCTSHISSHIICVDLSLGASVPSINSGILMRPDNTLPVNSCRGCAGSASSSSLVSQSCCGCVSRWLSCELS